MTTPVCRNPYDRPNGVRLHCTYPRNHGQECSWDAIYRRDVTTPVCRNPYDRPNGVRLHCTYPRNHGGSCSWHSIYADDVAEAATRVDYTPQAVQAFLDSMTRGEMDEYIEAILAVAHNRKRARRGTAGFTH